MKRKMMWAIVFSNFGAGVLNMIVNWGNVASLTSVINFGVGAFVFLKYFGGEQKK